MTVTMFVDHDGPYVELRPAVGEVLPPSYDVGGVAYYPADFWDNGPNRYRPRVPGPGPTAEAEVNAEVKR